MSVTIYSASVPVFQQMLRSLDGLLSKAESHAEGRKIDPAALLQARLFPDMFPLLRQVRTATDHAVNAAARLAGKELPKFANDETTIAQLKERIAKAIAFLKSVQPGEIDGTEDKDISITFPNGNVREFKGQGLLIGNSLPNFYFHVTTAYALMRQAGVDLGKRDFLGGI